MPTCITLARVVLLTVVLGTGVALSKQDLMESGAGGPAVVNKHEGVAIHGYDAVAYREDHEAVRGSPEFMAAWQGAQWQFASERNRARFLADPTAYAPQYGGFGAYGASLGKTYDVDPAVFDVVDGRVFLHRNERVRELWRRNPDGYIAEADEIWRHRARADGS